MSYVGLQAIQFLGFESGRYCLMQVFHGNNQNIFFTFQEKIFYSSMHIWNVMVFFIWNVMVFVVLGLPDAVW